MGAFLALGRGDEAALQRAGADVRAGHESAALAELDGIGGQVSGRAAAVRGYAYSRGRRYDRAAAAFAAAVRHAPNDWVLQRDYAIVLRRLGQGPRASARMQRALALNPRMQVPRGFRVVKRRTAAGRRQ